MAEAFRFGTLGQSFQVACTDRQLDALVRANWQQLPSPSVRPVATCTVGRDAEGSVSVVWSDGSVQTVADSAQLLHQLEYEVVVRLQQQRSDLFFVHAAVLERDGAAQLLVAASGSGKSTTAWALTHHGFRYLSDELAPIDVAGRQVHAYPHALCLKQAPPAHYPLPPETFRTAGTLHIPARCLPLADLDRAYPLQAIWFLDYDPSARAPLAHPISHSEAAARLYAQGLNQLAHPKAGLDAAVAITASLRCFVLSSAELPATCELIEATVAARSTVA